MAVRGRAHRARGGGSKKIMLQGRVDEQTWLKANRAADAGGISLAAYLQHLVERDSVDANGCPIWLEPREGPRESEDCLVDRADPTLTQGLASKLDGLMSTTVNPHTGRQWTNTALAEACAVLGTPCVQSYISQLRSGQRDNPSAALLGTIARALGADVRYFYDDAATKPNDQRAERELSTRLALMTPGVEELTWKLAGMPDRSIAYLSGLLDYFRDVEGLPPLLYPAAAEA